MHETAIDRVDVERDVDRIEPLRLAWSRRGEGGVDFAANAVEVDLSRLKEGHYVVAVDLNDGRRVERRIQIIRFTGAT